MFGIVFPTENPTIPVKATLPQTFTDIVGRQISAHPGGLTTRAMSPPKSAPQRCGPL